MPISVLLVDDQELFRRAIRAYLDRSTDIRVLAEAVDGATAVVLAGELRPDVVLMDFSLPDMDGIEALRRIRDQHPEIAVVVLSGYADDEETCQLAREAGAAALLDKAEVHEALLPAIRLAVRRGG